jgi:hypothetical protein
MPRTPRPARLPAYFSDPAKAYRHACTRLDVHPESPEEQAEYRERADTYTDHAHWLSAQPQINVYRAITIPRAGGLANVNFDCLGKAWSCEADRAGTYGLVPYHGNQLIEIVLWAEVAPRYVDWDYGFASFMYYGEDQWEISLLPHSPVAVRAILKPVNYWFRPPIPGNTGSAGETWSQTCREPARPRPLPPELLQF